MKRLLWLLLLVPLMGQAVSFKLVDGYLQAYAQGEAVKRKQLWLKPAWKDKLAQIWGGPFRKLRVPYWQWGNHRLWVFDRIGKERPITIAVQTSAGRIERVKVLAFREPRGGEVQYPFFTRQFEGAGLKSAAEIALDRDIDGITGATLSVNAVTTVAELALFLDGLVGD